MSVSIKQRNNRNKFNLSQYLTDPYIKYEIIKENDIKTLDFRKHRLKQNIDKFNRLKTKFMYNVSNNPFLKSKQSNTIISTNGKNELKPSKSIDVGIFYGQNKDNLKKQIEKTSQINKNILYKNKLQSTSKSFPIKLNFEGAIKKGKINKMTEKNKSNYTNIKKSNDFFMTNILSPIRNTSTNFSPNNQPHIIYKLPEIKSNSKVERLPHPKTMKYHRENIPLLELNTIKDSPIKPKTVNDSNSGISDESNNNLVNKLIPKNKENNFNNPLASQHMKYKTINQDLFEFNNDNLSHEMELKYNLLDDKNKLKELNRVIRSPKRLDKTTQLFNKIYKMDNKFTNDILKLQKTKNLPLIDYQNHMVGLLSLRMSKENLRKLSQNLKEIRDLADKVEVIPKVDWNEISEQIYNASYKNNKANNNQRSPDKTKMPTIIEQQKPTKGKENKINESFNRVSAFLPDFLVEKFRNSLKFK